MSVLLILFLVAIGLGTWSARHWRAMKTSSGAEKKYHLEDAVVMSIAVALIAAVGVALLVYT